MAGFTFNGIGASDSYYMLKELPGHLCRCCKKSDMAVMELRMKVRIVYIPTITLYKKYAVVCPKCKEGFYITEEQKNYLLNHDSSCLEITAEGVRILAEEDQKNSALLPDAGEVEEEQPMDDATEAPTDLEDEESETEDQEALTCPQCHAEIAEGALFCMKCGCKLDRAMDEKAESIETFIAQVEDLAENKEKDNVQEPADDHGQTPVAKFDVAPQPSPFTYTKAKVCPECGMHATGDKTVCSICGTKLE